MRRAKQSGRCSALTCTDIDECAAGRCGANRRCTNTPGSYSCGSCQPTFEERPDRTCHCPIGTGLVGSRCEVCTPSAIARDERCVPVPSTFRELPTNPTDSNMGRVVTECMQGLAHSDTHWFWSTTTLLQRVPRASGYSGAPDKTAGIPEPFRRMGCDHFGDPDFYDGRLYVPLSGKGRLTHSFSGSTTTST